MDGTHFFLLPSKYYLRVLLLMETLRRYSLQTVISRAYRPETCVLKEGPLVIDDRLQAFIIHDVVALRGSTCGQEGNTQEGHGYLVHCTVTETDLRQVNAQKRDYSVRLRNKCQWHNQRQSSRNYYRRVVDTQPNECFNRSRRTCQGCGHSDYRVSAVGGFSVVHSLPIFGKAPNVR